MQLREATPADAPGIRSVAAASLEASYADVLGPETIAAAVDHWYGEALEDAIEDDGSVYLVAVDDEVRAFSQSYVGGPGESVGEIHWLHVAPDCRQDGLGRAVLQFTETTLRRRGIRQFRGRVLAANEAGVTFYRANGYETGTEREVEIGGETFTERLFEKQLEQPRDESAPLERRELPDGEPVFVAFDEPDRASRGPLYAVYHDRDRSERYGWFCSACGSFDVAMEPMGRAECTRCGNRRKPTRWDAAYL
jgi:ribosomal protein S18 acetylase RimI-like enzyme